MSTIFETLSAVDISDKIKQKNQMNYLPWSSAWEFVKTIFPDCSYKVITTENGCIYHTDQRTCWVETEVTVNGETQRELLPVLNYRNQPVTYDDITSADVNKSIKRCLVKNLALFGLGLSLWYGEELSDTAKAAKEESESTLKAKKTAIVETAKSKIASGADKDIIYNIIAELNSENKNPMSIKSADKADEILKRLEEV